MNDLFLHFLQDIYYAEKAALRSLTKVAKAAEGEELKAYVAEHRESGKEPIEKLEKVFEAVGKRPRAKTCAAMNGLIEEIEEAISEGEKGPVLDAALIAGLQGMEHYAIARFGAMKAWAKTMDNEDAAQLLGELIDEAKEDDSKLNEIAEGHVNEEANEEEGEDEEDEDGEDEDDDEEDDEDEDDEEGDDEDEGEDDEEEDEEPKPEPEAEKKPAPKRPAPKTPAPKPAPKKR